MYKIHPLMVSAPCVCVYIYLYSQEGSLSVETNHFLLIHGGGFGAWCWYKLIATLEGAGFIADAIDLSGSGIDSTDPNSILGLDIYTKPLIDWLKNLNETKKVLIVSSLIYDQIFHHIWIHITEGWFCCVGYIGGS